jgi:curli biogenesis system outer membrane secretion channel CsgG
MKRNVNILVTAIVLGFMLSLAGICFAQSGGLRYTITVSKFENRSNWHGQWDLGDGWGAVLTDSLHQTGRFIVLGESDMRSEALQEQDFAASGRAAGGGKTVVIGQMTPAQLLVKGEITHFADVTDAGGGGVNIKGFHLGGGGSMAEINVVMYIVDSSTGMVMASKKCYGQVKKMGISAGGSYHGYGGNLAGFKKTNAGKAMEKAVDEGVSFLIAQLDEIPWTGTVILAKGSKVYINRGEREGVTVGQAFNVGKAEILRDPDTGEILDHSLNKVATIQVSSVKQKIAICDITSGSGIQKGMTVVLP